jgi:hypothetical protein
LLRVISEVKGTDASGVLLNIVVEQDHLTEIASVVAVVYIDIGFLPVQRNHRLEIYISVVDINAAG